MQRKNLPRFNSLMYITLSWRNLKTQIYFYGLTSMLIRHDNGVFRKRSSNQRNLETPAFRFRVDEKHFENGAYPLNNAITITM